MSPVEIPHCNGLLPAPATMAVMRCMAGSGPLARPGTPLVMRLGLARTKKNRRRPARNRRPADGSGGGLLQIGCGRQIELAGDDERRAAPIGAEPSRINRGEVTREPCRVVTRERVA